MRLNVTQIYREIVSGETISARPVMQQLLQEVTEGLWEGVIVMEIERLARGATIDQGLVAQAFKISNTKIITPLKTFDPNNEYDEEYFEFNLFMSRREFKTINRRIQRGRIASAKEGKFLSSTPPYGYDKVKIKNDKGYTLDANPEQAKAVTMIYNWYTEGELLPDGSYMKLGTSRIARKLNELGIKPLCNTVWTKSSISDILKNPVYTGKIRWSYRKEQKSYVDGKIKKKRPNPTNDDYILVNGLHEAIISEEIYNKAQHISKNRLHTSVPGNNILKNPLTGLLYCGKCNSLMTRLAKNSKTPYDVVKCPNVYCDNISAPLYLVEGVIIDSLKSWLNDFKVQWKVNKLNVPYAQAINSKRDEISQSYDKMSKLQEQKERIFSLLEQGIYTVSEFTERKDKIIKEIEELNTSISTLEDSLKSLQVQASNSDVFIPMAESILDNYYNLDTATARNAALKELVDRIEYVKTEHNKKGERDNTNFKIEIFPIVIKP
jgi:DNA invertase Pin-like site-specific DNA recombinase